MQPTRVPLHQPQPSPVRSSDGPQQVSRGSRRSQRQLGRAGLSCPAAIAGGAVVLAIAITAGVGVGSVSLSPAQVWRVLADRLAGRHSGTVADEIVWQIRLPRVLLAAVVGAALTTAGTVVQALVRNALADPFLLGVSSGASVGATAVLLFGVFGSLGLWALSVGSILGALVAMVAVFAISREGDQLTPTRLIIGGVTLAALFQAFTSFLVFRGDPHATQSVLFWLLGSFGRATWTQLPLPIVVLVVASAYLMVQTRTLNALALGAEAATSLGVDVRRLRQALFVVTSVIAGVAVAVSGVIGFVGLVVPHIVRLAVGSDHRRILPVGVLWGASFMVVGDLVARTMVAPQEMPIGVITAFVGAPVLLVLIRRRSYRFGTGS
jgi:iron complex transport system permease protein